MENILITERYGSHSVRRFYTKHRESDKLELHDDSQRFTSLSHFFKTVFLPQGYPESVSDDYLQYQIWDTVQAFCSSITGTLATQAVLEGVGVGDENATVLAATVTWLMKDGTGMVGRILFAWMKGTYLDCDCKRWRLFADILNDFSIFLDITAPFFKDYFRLIVCVSGVGKSIVGVAGGATRAALTQHQARRNNMADVSAKDGSQETLVNLAALICSLTLVPMVAGHYGVVWILFALFTMMHIFANYSAVKSVTMDTLNQSRLHYVCQRYVTSGRTDVPSLRQANLQEPVLWSLPRQLQIHLGTSVSNVVASYDDLGKLSKIFQGENYLLNVDLSRGTVNIALRAEADTPDQLKACVQAEILNYAASLKRSPQQIGLPSDHIDLILHNLIEATRHGDTTSMVAHSYRYTQEVLQDLLQLCQSQRWSISPVLLCAEEWRADWDAQDLQGKKQH